MGLLWALKAIEKWSRYIRAARAVGDRLPPGRYHEVRYEGLVTDTEKTMRELLEFLGEEWTRRSSSTTSNATTRHLDPLRRLRLRATADRPGAGRRHRSRVGAHRREMDPLLRLLVHLRSGGTLRQLGYR